ncbi:MAG: hypothetical protein PHS73_04970, partial [Candidatus Peribacteraceae bacterium]|nr:hypothetical protein [Candidatus Peribacteraceae bacterium]
AADHLAANVLLDGIGLEEDEGALNHRMNESESMVERKWKMENGETDNSSKKYPLSMTHCPFAYATSSSSFPLFSS